MTVVAAEPDVLGDAHRGDARVSKRLFGKATEPRSSGLLAGARVGDPVDVDSATRELALPRDDLEQLVLAVARDAGDAHDLTGLHLERDSVENPDAPVVDSA